MSERIWWCTEHASGHADEDEVAGRCDYASEYPALAPDCEMERRLLVEERSDIIDKLTVGMFGPIAEVLEADARQTVTPREVYKVLAERDDYDAPRDARIMVLAAAAWRWAKDQDEGVADVRGQ